MPRSIVSSTKGGYTSQNFDIVGGRRTYYPLWASSSTQYFTRSYNSVRADIVKTPGITELRASNKHLKPLPYSYDIIDESWTRLGNMTRFEGPTSGTAYKGCLVQVFEGSFTSQVRVNQVVLPSWARMDAIATNKVLGKVKDQKVNLLQTFAERAQTARLLTKSVTGISELLLAVLSRDWKFVQKLTGMNYRQVKAKAKEFRSMRKKAGIAADRISEQWLAVQYGWKPLVGEIYGVCDELTSREYNPQEPWIATRATHWEGSNTSTVSSDMYRHGLRTKVHIYEKYGTTFRLDYTIPRPDREQIKALGLTNPAMIAWELMPWSFVIDWALPVGNWVNSFDATVGITFVDGSKTQWIEREYTQEYYGLGKPTTGTWHSGNGNVYKGSRKYGKRTVLSSSPIPRAPQWRNPYTITRLANAMALLRLLASRGSPGVK